MIDDDQIYVVVDIEADGPVPGLYSMLSIGAVATTDANELDSFYKKIEPIPDAFQDPETMAWWRAQPEAWAEVTHEAIPAVEVMNEFIDWLESLGKKPLFVAHPVALDYTFVSWYLWKFTNNNPFTDEGGAPIGLDLSSFISGKFSLSYKKSKRKGLASWMKVGMPEHSHNALDDARGFGVILRNVLNKNKSSQ